MNLLIVEDEVQHYRHLLETLDKTQYDYRVCGNTDSIRSTVHWLTNHPPPDLIIMDIGLKDGRCFEIFDLVEIVTPVIFTAEDEQDALRVFQFFCLDYLLKPLQKEDLERSLKKFSRILYYPKALEAQQELINMIRELKQKQLSPHHRQRFLVKQGQRLVSIEVNDIAWFHADGKLCFFKTWENHRYLLDYTLEELNGILDPEQFFRVNRSYIVHHRSIRNINSYFKGKMLLQLQPGTEENDVVISKERAPELKQWLGK